MREGQGRGRGRGGAPRGALVTAALLAVGLTACGGDDAPQPSGRSMEAAAPVEERAVLVLRPKAPDMADENFRTKLLERAAELRASCDEMPRPR